MFMVLEDVALFPHLTGWDHEPLVALENWPQAERDAFALVCVRVVLDGAGRGEGVVARVVVVVGQLMSRFLLSSAPLLLLLR